MSLLENFRGSSSRRQALVAAVAVVVIGAVLMAAYFLLLRRPYDVLFSNLRTMDAATIVAELDKKKVPYRLSKGGATILVPRDMVDGVRLNVMSEDLPIKGTVGFELFNKSDMGLTEFAQKINYQRALQGELARTIMTMDGVDSARVHLSIADDTVFRDERHPSKASVTVVARAGSQVPPDAVRGVQRLVAAAVPDLSTEDVVVLDEQGRVISSDLPRPAAPTAQEQERQAIEQYYASRVRLVLQGVVPAKVTVSAPTATAAPSADGSGSALEKWTPAARSFPLKVDVAIETPPSPQAQAQINSLVGQAIGLNPGNGDTLTISTSAAAPPVVSGPQAAALLPASPPPLSVVPLPSAGPLAGLSPSSFWLTHLVPLLLLLLGAAYLLHRRRAGPRTLTVKQRSDYARRLRALLDDGGARAPSHN